MAASNLDKFKKAARKWVGQIGAGGVADAVVTTVPLSATTNLPTDTGVEVVIDRVDSNGTKTPTLEETVVGVVSGSNLTSVVRGVEGTAQAHAAGAVVEVLLSSDMWNDVVDGIVAEHSQLGAHTAASATAAGTVELATIAETTTGTDATRAVTPDGLHDMTSLSGAVWMLDEDDMASDSATKVPSQQSVKAHVASGTVTMTNKRITRRAPAITQSATPTINTDVTDVAHITGLAQAITSMTTNLSGTPVEGDVLRIDFTDDGTARAITWGAKFEASGSVALPTTTVLSVRLDVGFVWNTVTSKWRCVAVA